MDARDIVAATDCWEAYARWRAVPDRVVASYHKVAATALDVKAAHSHCPGRVYWHSGTGQTVASDPGNWPDVDLVDHNWLLVKRAAGDFLTLAAEPFDSFRNIMGTRDAMVSAIVGGLLGSGVGYSKSASFSFNRFSVFDVFPAALPAAFAKAATATGAMYVPSIPVDAFNRVIWTDVLAPSNPFGFKDYRGDNDQPLRTPPPVAAAVSGLISGTGAATGRSSISPAEFAMTAATAAGTGYLGATVAGQVLGALAGMSPESQQRLQQVGLWGGLLTGVARSVFG